MKTMRLFVLLALAHWSVVMQAQNDTASSPEIELIHANKLLVDENTPEGATKLVGKVQLKHQEAFMFCDSAYMFDNNSLKAYGHVRIEEGDSLLMTGDSLFYDGEEKLARVRGRVKIDNKASILKTTHLDYHRATSMAHYYNGGKIRSEKEGLILDSKIGYYYSKAKVFHFKQDVVMNHPDYKINTDTMHYSPDLEKTWFFGPTEIDFDKKNIYCEYGWFDQINKKANFVRNARIISAAQTMQGDTIEYDQATEVGIAKCNVSIVDTNEKFEVEGDYAIHHEQDSVSMVTKNMLLKQDMDGDTFFLTADTLYAETDTSGGKIIRTHYHSMFYKSDMQGRCDSLVYRASDSIFYLYTDPILWADANQLTADSIRISMKDSKLDKMFMDQNAFIISSEDSSFYNQIKGRNMIGYFKDDELHKVDVHGNGETVYYPREEDQSLIGVNKTECSNMTIRIDSNQIQTISFYDNPTAKLTPTDDMPKSGMKLEDFNWRVDERPHSVNEMREMSIEQAIEMRKERETATPTEQPLETEEETLNEVPNLPEGGSRVKD